MPLAAVFKTLGAGAVCRVHSRRRARQCRAAAKAIGELANVGTNAAVANAVFHATGKRVRELPVRL
jgi:CO/xanthine dehydrogenase Mo-binding subunit